MEKHVDSRLPGHTVTLKVRYYETDAMGIVHHSNYIRWFEVARRTTYYKPTRAPAKVKPELATPIKDMIGSQATKGMHVLGRFAPIREACGVWTDGRMLRAIEAYPSACKRSACIEALRTPFYVDGAPSFQNGDHISNGAHGKPLYVTATVLDLNDQPIANALVHTWQSDSDGFYDVQRPNQEMQGRGNFRTDLQGRIFFQSILPVAYPVPTDGPVGDVLRASGRHPWRPAHVHFMIEAPGYRTLVTHIFRSDDEYLESDVVFGVRSSLIADMPEHAAGQRPPFGDTSSEAFHTLDITFRLVKL